ncbi:MULTISPECIES: DeoR/GlpR family DNA-binding transcription regulator [Pantoea]|uniref:DeoR family transcriptional regulator n=1 Tax=Pantoea latae TaxID=1964541 RepID=A0A1V9DMC6_9GAMM|nr:MULTISPECIES: DeoR/GlpR family DNA-binding transcription regulator [Pantoea]OQP35009.1 DeoR family transcriptional regulator [Pantoea latae]
MKSKTEQLADMQQRREKILEMIREDGTVTVKALTEAFGLTEATIRTDLRMLQKQGFVQRYHGGATLMTGKQNTGALLLERQTHLEEKEAIGRLAAQHIENGDTVIFDSGTTTTAIAEAIGHIRRLSVVTTAVNIALKLGGEPGINILLTGGTFKFPTLSTSGEKAANFFENVLAEKLFLATACISPRLGLSFPSETDIKVKMAMIKSASQVYVVADSSKIDKVSMFALPCDWSHIHYLITDDGISAAQIAAFEALGVNVLVASLPQAQRRAV